MNAIFPKSITSSEIILRGFGQVMFQNNFITGLLFLIGIFFNSVTMGIGALAGGVVSTLAAIVSGYPKDEIRNGLYGFNGVLTGIAIFFYFDITVPVILALIIGSAVTTILMNKMSKRIPAYTAPFVLTTWIIILILQQLKTTQPIDSTIVDASSIHFFEAISKGFSQVMFQDNFITGIIFFIAILLNSPRSAFYALYAAVVGSLIAYVLGFSFTSINLGLWGYNGILCAIALGNKGKNGFWKATLAIIISAGLMLLLQKINIIILTAPFVVGTWIVLWTNPLLKYFKKQEYTR